MTRQTCFAIKLCISSLAIATILLVGSQTTAQTQAEATYGKYAEGLLARETYVPPSTGKTDVRIWDLLVAPGKKTAPFSLPGAAVLEVRSGGGNLDLDDGSTTLATGATLSVAEGRRLVLDNSKNDRQLAIRAVLITASGEREDRRDNGADRDGSIEPNRGDFKEDPEFISPPTLRYPIYACASSVVVKNFIPGAKLEVFADGVSIGGTQSWLSDGQNIDVSIVFAAGQTITAQQTFNGATSGLSNAVPVTSHLEDYPNGMPQPRLGPLPPLQCGRAIGIADVIPGALARVFAENPNPGGGFLPAVEVGKVSDFGYTFVSPAFETDARVYTQAELCSEKSPVSDVQIVAVEPATIPAPSLDPVHQNTNIVTVWGLGGNPNPLLNGATLDIFNDAQPPGQERVGGQPTPGGGQQVFIDPPASTGNYWSTQALCTTGPKSDPTPTVPCKDLPAATIKPPMPGDMQVTVITYVPGAEILIFASGEEVGHSGAPVINLKRPLGEGETVIVLQRLGDCDSGLVQVVEVNCTNATGGDAAACSGDWPAFRHSGIRNGTQPQLSALADPYKVKKLKEVWRFTPPDARTFRAGPVVFEDRVYVGNGNGRMYALDANSGALLWQYPPVGQPALLSQFESNPSSCGIGSSAAIARIRGERNAVIFGAPDQSIGQGLGSGRLFALDPVTGSEIWKSPEIAILNGTNFGNTSQLHEQIGYSSPLVLGDRVYIGIADHGDNPIQVGRVAAVDIVSGNLVGSFGFKATDTRGGGVWSAPAGGLAGEGVYVTTGNAKCWNPGVCQSEPAVNHSLSMLRLDANGNVSWKLQPVPFEMDEDPDWAAGPNLGATSCGDLALSTMKDGWSYAMSASGALQWQFPATGVPFTPADGTIHGDSRYQFSGAVWNDVFLGTMGGEHVQTDVNSGFGRLHALNACSAKGDRVRWLADVPGATAGSSYQLGPPSVTHGIVFVGTGQGHLVALADPSVWPSAGSRCSNPKISLADCQSQGFKVVPQPNVLFDQDLKAGPILAEPALAGDRVFVATGWLCATWGDDSGSVIMLAPAN